MLLFRKIDESRWAGKAYLSSTSVTELNTLDDELSAWMYDGTVSELDLGLAFILTQKCIRDICCVKIPDSELTAKHLMLRQQNSTTPYVAMRPYHTNIQVPTAIELCDLAGIIYNLYQDHLSNCRYFTETDLKMHFYNTLVNNAIEIDFRSSSNQEKWRVIKEMQKTMGGIDFSILSKVIPGK